MLSLLKIYSIIRINKEKGEFMKIGMRSIKTMLAVFFSISIYVLLLLIDLALGIDHNDWHAPSNMYTPFFAGIAAVYTLHKDRKSSFNQAKIRSLGSIVGGYFGMIVIFITEYIFITLLNYEETHFILYKLIVFAIVSLAILPLITITVKLKQKSAVFITCLTYLSVTISIRNGGMPVFQFATNRILSTLVGAFISLGINNFSLLKNKNKNILFVSSLDNNFINSKGEIDAFVKYELNNLYFNKMPLTFVTTRTLTSLEPIFLDVDVTFPMVVMNGSAEYHFNTKQYVNVIALDSKIREYIDKQLKEHGLLQAIARTNRLYEGKDYGLIVDYRGLLLQLNDAMNVYAGDNGLDNFDKKDLEGLITDVLTSVSGLRQAYTNLENNFNSIINKNDEEEYEVLLEKSEQARIKFYNDLCEFGKKLSLVLSSENAYSAIADDNPNEIKMYKDKFVFYSKLRVMIKKRCAETLDNKDYENEMRNLLDKHMSVSGLKILTKPLDIMDKGELEKEIEDLGSKASKADAIRHNLSKNISINYDTNPAYYDSFSKRIKEVLNQYKEKVISDAEYLQAMNKILNDFRANKSGISYPKCIEQSVHAQAFYGVILPIINDTEEYDINLIGEIAIKISEIIQEHTKVDWNNNADIHNAIAQAIDDMFYEYDKADMIKLPFDKIDKITENVTIVALKRF